MLSGLFVYSGDVSANHATEHPQPDEINREQDGDSDEGVTENPKQTSEGQLPCAAPDEVVPNSEPADDEDCGHCSDDCTGFESCHTICSIEIADDSTPEEWAPGEEKQEHRNDHPQYPVDGNPL